MHRRHLFTIAGIGFLPVYDILCAGDFNPNERTGFVFSRSTPRLMLPERLRRAIILFYQHQVKRNERPAQKAKEESGMKPVERVYQCRHCFTIYDPAGMEAGQVIGFDNLPVDYYCPLCEAPKEDFRLVISCADVLNYQPEIPEEINSGVHFS